jgi:FkbM family methyltransferase
MVVVDIGANIGYYALLEARLVGRRGRVIAVEPVPENACMFLRNVRANGYENVTFRQVAISNRNGMCKMHLSTRSNHHSLHNVPWQTADLEVPVCTLDALLKDEVVPSLDLIRMDWEGHEIVLLDGMAATIDKYHPRLLVEVHPHIVGPDATIDYVQRLQLLGYSVEWLIDQERDVPWRYRFLKPEHLSMEDLLSDWRIHTHPRALMVMFQHEPAGATPASIDADRSLARC